MKMRARWLALAGLSLGVALAATAQQDGKGMKPPFGRPEDVAFAKKLWKATQGYEHWKLTTPVYKGQSPHGVWVRLFSTWVTIDGHSYPVIIKDNYGGRGVSKARVEADRRKWLKIVTMMVQREPGYDPENRNWFWVKFNPDGSIMKNEKGMPLAGRVAKGMNKGCISCHSQAAGGDYLYSNDP